MPDERFGGAALEPRTARPTPEWLSSGEVLPWSWAVGRLEAERNYWLVSARRDGFPQARPVWGLWFGPGMFFSIQRGGFHRTAAAHGEGGLGVTVHTESASRVVIVEGIADRILTGRDGSLPTLELDPGIRAEATDRYNAKYGLPSDAGARLNFLVRPRRIYGWTENEAQEGGDTGTRWDFD